MSKYRYTCTKQYFNLPCAHRQHGHDGHCCFIHGYSRSFKFYFTCNELDANNFVF
ncbi:MAG: 6-carboxytetrahydropterin synthase, partial [SAR324 cluster bacterium]|nr:6-carboxytetrahydropterin synthase [SAR324 cluster bacterium]